ncbi:MAG: hypothetical protein ACK4G3_05830 [bacterium]
MTSAEENQTDREHREEIQRHRTNLALTVQIFFQVGLSTFYRFMGRYLSSLEESCFGTYMPEVCAVLVNPFTNNPLSGYLIIRIGLS